MQTSANTNQINIITLVTLKKNPYTNSSLNLNSNYKCERRRTDEDQEIANQCILILKLTQGFFLAG